MKNNILRILLPILLTILVMCCSFILPGYLLDLKTKNDFNETGLAPEEYYLTSNTVMARNASEKLSPMDRVNLITGKWASTMYEASPEEAFLTETEAVELATTRLEIFNRVGVYPYSLSSNYNNWYSWSTKVYRYTDSSFNTYTAYLWVIRFKKFDNSLEHTVIMTEDGIILTAEVNEVPTSPRSISYAYSGVYFDYITGAESISCNSITNAANQSYINVTYPDIDMTGVTYMNPHIVNISETNSEVGNFLIYQYSDTERYGFGMVNSN